MVVHNSDGVRNDDAVLLVKLILLTLIARWQQEQQDQ